ncbi:MAG: hypothetical protein KAR38_01525 [Calditrichia bacterium]|nr:hypothetical protein [Calditrichia bacterium]
MNGKKPFALKVLLFLLSFLSLGALFGGGALTIDPSGELIKMPIEILKNSVFSNFLIPGIVLFTLFGVFPILIIYALLKRPQWEWSKTLNLCGDMYWAWTCTIYIGFGQIIWISIQTLIINHMHFVHTFYIFLGIAIVSVALMTSVRNYFSQER